MSDSDHPGTDGVTGEDTNDLAVTSKTLEPYRSEIAGIAVESTFNWCWLVDGLAEAGYEVRLANMSEVRQYEGLKYTDDRHDVFWLAYQMRLWHSAHELHLPERTAFASYCRCVDSRRTGSEKRERKNNAKNGNEYLAWAFFEAAYFAIRYLPATKRFYDRKAEQRHPMVAMKALSHKMVRACYYILREQVPFDPACLFE